MSFASNLNAITNGLNALRGSVADSSQGSVNSGMTSGNSWQQAASQTDAASARAFSAEQAELAYERQKKLMQMEMDYNTREAEKQRQWELENANTVYTRSVENMKAAGINPILAANMGLSAASVGSGSTASISGASAPMAQSFMDTSSASAGGSQSYGENHGSSWGSSHSEESLATGLQLLGTKIGAALDTLASAKTLKEAEKIYEDYINSPSSGPYKDYQDMIKKNNKEEVGDNWLLKKMNGLQLKFTGIGS